MSDLKAKIESLELEKIELERKNLDILANLKSESPEENLKILDEGAEEVGEIKHKLLGKKIIENILKSQKLEWISVRPKFGIGHGIGSEPIFFPRPKLFFFKFYSFFPTSWGSTSFYKLENKPSPSKINYKYLMFRRKFGFRGPFMIEINTSCYR